MTRDPRPLRWSDSIPLVTFLAVVFAAGVLYQKIDALTETVRGIVPRIEALERSVFSARHARR